jgi:serine/threonine protein kinase
MLEIGKKIGEYILVEHIDSGGFGDVWKAEVPTFLGTDEFALKFIRPPKDKEGINLEKVKKEMAAWRKVSGLPHIVSVIKADKFENYIYIVSEYADGGSLENWLWENGGKAESAERAVQITLEILRGLESMHKQHIAHRDVKPANILIKKGIFCLADFGISRQIKTYPKATRSLGTFEYMSPEALARNPSISEKTDIWSTGVILQELLTGKLPFTQETGALEAAILHGTPNSLSENIPKSLREIVEKALQKKPENRFASAQEMRVALERVKWGNETIEEDDFKTSEENEDLINLIRELPRNPKEILAILIKRWGIKSLDDILIDDVNKVKFTEPNQEDEKQPSSKGIANLLPKEPIKDKPAPLPEQRRKYITRKIKSPKRIPLWIKVSSAIVLVMIIGAVAITKMPLNKFSGQEITTPAAQTSNEQSIFGENASNNTNENSNVSSNSAPVFEPTRTPTPKKNKTPNYKNTNVTESPAPTQELQPAVNSIQTPVTTGESPKPKPTLPKPPAQTPTPTPKQTPDTNGTQTVKKNSNKKKGAGKKKTPKSNPDCIFTGNC